MLSAPSHRLIDNPYAKDAAYTIIFGILSVVLSKVQFHIPGVGDSNLREIPLLICLFHIRNPIFIIGLSLFTLIGSPSGVPYWAVYGVHLVPLFIARVFFKAFEKKQLPNSILGMVWMAMTVAYYLIFLLPLVVIALQLTLTNSERS